MARSDLIKAILASFFFLGLAVISLGLGFGLKTHAFPGEGGAEIAGGFLTLGFACLCWAYIYHNRKVYLEIGNSD